jgi:hypothetical protein
MYSVYIYLALCFLGTRGAHAAATKSIGAKEEETGFYQSITVTDESPLLTKKSKYQTIEVQESKYYGKILVLVRLAFSWLTINVHFWSNQN